MGDNTVSKAATPRRWPTLTPNHQNNHRNNHQNNHQNTDVQNCIKIIKLSTTVSVEAIDKLIGLQHNTYIYNYDNRTHLAYNQEAAERKRAHMRSPPREETERRSIESAKTDRYRHDREPEREPKRIEYSREENRTPDRPSRESRDREEERGRMKRNKRNIAKRRIEDVPIRRNIVEQGTDDVSSRRSSTSTEDMLYYSQKLLRKLGPYSG